MTQPPYAFTWLAIVSAVVSIGGFVSKKFQVQQWGLGFMFIFLGVAMLMGERLRWFGPLAFLLLSAVGILQIWVAIQKRVSA